MYFFRERKNNPNNPFDQNYDLISKHFIIVYMYSPKIILNFLEV